MKRLMAILAFLFGGYSVGIAKPVDCSLIESSQPRSRRSEATDDDGPEAGGAR